MKSARRRVEVNLDELDQVLDGARQAPLSEADYDKLKGALHALAAMLVRPHKSFHALHALWAVPLFYPLPPHAGRFHTVVSNASPLSARNRGSSGLLPDHKKMRTSAHPIRATGGPGTATPQVAHIRAGFRA